MASTEPEHGEEEETATGEEEDTGAHVAPIVKLEEVSISTGEEEEDAILDLKAKLYRFDKDGNQWKERGAGNVKLLKHKKSGKVRLVMRQSKTLKISANHLVLPTMTVQEHSGNDKSCVWHAPDFADGELKEELFCIRFATVENCKNFMETFQDLAETETHGKKEDDLEATATATAGLLEKLSVGDSKPEEKGHDGAPVVANEEQEEAACEQIKPDEHKKDEPVPPEKV